jgi:hypothetical protein
MATIDKRKEYNRRVYLKRIEGNIKKQSKMSFKDSEILSYLGYRPKEEEDNHEKKINEIDTTQKQNIFKIYKLLHNFILDEVKVSTDTISDLLKIKV